MRPYYDTMLLPIGNPDDADSGIAGRYSARLREQLGIPVPACEQRAPIHPARRWAQCGLMTLTGTRPTLCPVALASCADGALDAFRKVAGIPVLPEVEGAELLAERAAVMRDHSDNATGGHCRILPSLDGSIAINLARADDWDLVPAWLETGAVEEWPSLQAQVSRRTTRNLLARGRMLGLAVADAQSAGGEPRDWLRLGKPPTAAPRLNGAPLVVDLSSLWAGPLCSSLWQAAGADVIKVESTQRPDGARRGPAAFFALLNQGKRPLTLDLHKKSGQRELLDLIRQADIVLEGSRPRALRQMGIVAEELITELPRLTWVSITGYGRGEPQANWIAYGDDAGIAAGLSHILHQATGEWLICGDAIADPLTGLHAALAGWASWRRGGGHLIDIALEKTVRHCIAATAPGDGNYRERQARWMRYLHDNALQPLPPRCKRVAPPSTP